MTEIPRFGHRRRLRVGVLGGSFNPAHAGHRHVAEMALRRLRLDQVWLMVSPGNPLKAAAGMAPFATRLGSAHSIADGNRVIATAIEHDLGERYTADSLRALRRRFPRVRFVWLMGADNLAGLPHWRRWMDIARAMPFAVVPRPTYNHRALAGQAAQRLRHALRPSHAGPVLAGSATPAWSFLPGPQTGISATALRAASTLGPPDELSHHREHDDRQKAHRRAGFEAARQAPPAQAGLNGVGRSRQGAWHPAQESGGSRAKAPGGPQAED